MSAQHPFAPDQEAYATCFLLEGECGERLSALVSSLYAEFSPESAVEVSFLETMATARWRQMRLWQLERRAILNQVEQTQTGVDHAPLVRTAMACESMADNSRWSGFRQHRAWRMDQRRGYLEHD